MITAPFNFVPLSEKVFFPPWAEEKDELCEGMKVKKLKKVIFAGFERP